MGNDFIVIIHCLTYLSVHHDRRFSSQQLAHNASSNPVIVRKVMSLASSKGYVDVVNGANGGYKIQVDPKDISLGDLFILVGEDPASQVYVRNKERAATEVGIHSNVIRLAEETAQEELLAYVNTLNDDASVHGILVQLPLPKHIDTDAVLEAIVPEKDVDGFHPVNLGKLLQKDESIVPCTPQGIMEFFKEYNIDLVGKEMVIIGQSTIVGRPMALLGLNHGATVTVCHSRTKDLAKVAKRADILISAVGKAELITKDFVKEGAVVIDVGINRNEAGKLCGDVDFEEVAPLASAITPVPGGVGPMTIAMLLSQTVKNAKSKKE
mgnify:CR=1 FL=1